MGCYAVAETKNRRREMKKLSKQIQSVICLDTEMTHVFEQKGGFARLPIQGTGALCRLVT